MRKFKEGVAQAIRDYLDGEGFRYQYNQENGEFSMIMTLHKRLRSVHIRFFAGEDDFSTYVYLPLGPVVKDSFMMDKTAEFVVRVNYAICQGCLDFDMDDGEMRYKVNVGFEGLDVPTKDMVENSLLRALQTIEEYSDKLAYLLYCNVTAEEAYEADLSEGYFPREKEDTLFLEDDDEDDENDEDDDDDDEDDDDDDEDDGDEEDLDSLAGDLDADELRTRLRLLHRMFSDLREKAEKAEAEGDDDDDEEE